MRHHVPEVMGFTTLYTDWTAVSSSAMTIWQPRGTGKKLSLVDYLAVLIADAEIFNDEVNF